MESVRLKAHIGADGLLKLEMPLGVTDVGAEVVVIYTVQPRPARESWEDFIDAAYGSLASDPIERPAC
jgi:hypothetical protein